METWLILLAICALLICLVLTVSVLVVYSGLLDSIEVKAGKPPIGRVTIAYKFGRGQYKSVGPLFFEVAKLAPDNRALGIYYDDPETVAPARLRYAVACILAEDDQEVDGGLVKKFEAEGFKTMELPLVDNAVHTSFPYKTSISIFIGMQRVYPKLVEFIKEHGLEAHPCVEIYAGNTIFYMAPLDNQERFYVPESLEQHPGEEPHEPAYPVKQGQDDSAEDSPPAGPGQKLDLEMDILLRPADPTTAEVVGKVDEEGKKTASEDEEAESPEDSPDVDSSPITEEAQKGSDEESGSSFEELKMEGEEMGGKPHLQ